MMPFTSLPCYSLPSNVLRIINGYPKPNTNTNTNVACGIVPYNPQLFKIELFMIIFNMDH